MRGRRTPQTFDDRRTPQTFDESDNGKPVDARPEIEIIEWDAAPQGSQEWFDLRLGIPTASNFHIVLAQGVDGGESVQRPKYMRSLAGEILTGRPAEGKIVTAAMQRGKTMEDEAFEHYATRTFSPMRRISFIRRKLPTGRWVGSSPDGLVDKDKALEIKTMQPDLIIERLERGAGMPSEHRAQVQGTMWVGDLVAVDVMLFYTGFPITPRFTVRRDETYIRTLSNAVEVFDFELHQLVEKIRRMG
jgi:hypothetical protein